MIIFAAFRKLAFFLEHTFEKWYWSRNSLQSAQIQFGWASKLKFILFLQNKVVPFKLNIYVATCAKIIKFLDNEQRPNTATKVRIICEFHGWMAADIYSRCIKVPW
jgi:hypothetical protein